MIDKGRAVFLSLALVLASEARAQEEALRRAARLDAEQKCEEAERYYREAFAAAPALPAVLNNAGNHYLVCGQPAGFLRAFADDQAGAHAQDEKPCAGRRGW